MYSSPKKFIPSINLRLQINNRGGDIERPLPAWLWHINWILEISDNTEQSHRCSVESARGSWREDIWKEYNNHSPANQSESIVSLFTDFHVRLHVKKWPCYSKNSSSGYQTDTDKRKTLEVHRSHRWANHMWWIQQELISRLKQETQLSKSWLSNCGERVA